MLPAEITGALTSQTTPPVKEANGALGREDFLRMLIAQLENQDPLNPQEATEFTAQLAQFSSLEQLIAMRTAIEDLGGAKSIDRSLAATNLIDKQVLAETRQFDLKSEGLPVLSFELDANATSVVIDIKDPNGTLRRLDLGALGQGQHAIAWDGLDRNGQRPEPGSLSFRVSALANTTPLVAREFVEGRITGSTLGEGEPVLLMGSIVIPMNKVREIRSTASNGVGGS